ncbi:MAG: DNA adenine methylase [Micropruina sp.]|nr:DNA adenine methylase [Micropruina sp.]
MPTLMKCMPPKHRQYFEPFAGSAALFFACEPEGATLGDTNADLINFLDQLKSDPTLLHCSIAEMPIGKEHYYLIRASRPADALARAARFAYLNRFCFNGLYRTNRSGEFNVPAGKNTGRMPSLAMYKDAARVLLHANLKLASFHETLRDVDSGDFVYLDPPYPTDRQTYGEYGYSLPFPESDLKDAISELHGRGVRLMTTYPTADLTLGLTDFRTLEMRTLRQVASKTAYRRRRPEYLSWNYDAQLDSLYY